MYSDKKIVCFGDSNTYGYDPRSFWGDRYPADCRWVDLLTKLTGWTVCNEGMNGREIPRGHLCLSPDADLLIVMLGTNDLLQGTEPAIIVDRMSSFLNSLTIPKEHILLIAPPPLQQGEWVQSKKLIDASRALVKGYKALAGRLGIAFADSGTWGIKLAFDGVHFTEAGHRAFAEGLKETLKKSLHPIISDV